MYKGVKTALGYLIEDIAIPNGITDAAVRKRVKLGWNIEEALTKPMKQGGRR